MATLIVVAPPLYRDTDILILGILTRGELPNEVLCAQDDIDSITATVILGTAQVGAVIDISVLDYVFDTPKAGSMWPNMPTKFSGFNLAFPVPRDYFVSAGTYKVQVDVTLATGEKTHAVYQLPVKALPADSVIA